MFKYLNEETYIPADESQLFPKKCPKCQGKLVDNGGCGDGCCDDYKCTVCKYTFRVEMPD